MNIKDTVAKLRKKIEKLQWVAQSKTIRDSKVEEILDLEKESTDLETRLTTLKVTKIKVTHHN